jgi:DNA-3-methyladenine glycosylase
MHWCCNAVTGRPGQGTAVLLRAGAPLVGTAVMEARRPLARRPRELASGPARLTQALGIDRRHDGVDLCRPRTPIWIGDDGTPPPDPPGVSTRVGIRVAVDRPWRWFVPGDPNVSRAPGRLPEPAPEPDPGAGAGVSSTG